MDISKVQGFMNGGQVRDIFAEYNTYAGSAVVDLSRNYNVGDQYSNRIGTGNQIDLAFAEINANEGSEMFKLDHQDWSNGNQLKKVFLKLKILIDGTGPIWLGSMPTEITITQGAAWPWELDTYCYSPLAISYVSNLNLPAGITLNGDGSFSGTATNLGLGTAEFTATDTNGDTKSEWISWNVAAAAAASSNGDDDDDDDDEQ